MNFIILTFKSKNKKSLYVIHNWLNQKFIFKKKEIFKKIRSSKITLLKSPHVFKKAQQHFEEQLFKLSIFMNFDTLSTFIPFKNLINYIFQDNFMNYTYTYNNIKSNEFIYWLNNHSIYIYTHNHKLISKNLYNNRIENFTKYLENINLLGKYIIKFKY